MKISSIVAALTALLMVLALNACGDGKSDTGGAQENNVQCAANQILNNGQCQACPANQSVVGNQCVLQCASNQTIQNGQCITPAPQCTGNQIAQNGSCVACLEAQVPNIERTMCIDNGGQCESNEVEENGLCIACPAGQFASGNLCTEPPLNCGVNQIVQNKMCIDCAANEMVSNNMCVPIPVSCTPTQIIQNNMCVDCAANEMVSNNMCVPIPVTCGATQIIVNNMCVDCPAGDIVVNNQCQTPVVGNNPPIVDAGSPQTITLPIDTVVLGGSASDVDGLPNPPAMLTTTWSETTGTVNFGDVNSLTSTAKFTTAGSYTLTLTADDGDIPVMDSVVITVNAVVPPPNTAPVVNNITISPAVVTLPATASISGSVSDDGLPINTLTYTWSSSPGGVSFSTNGSTSPTTTATFPNSLAIVNYSIMLSVSDSQLSGAGSEGVTVNPAPVPMCGGVPLNGNICVLGCNGKDLIYGDTVLDSHPRDFGNCGAAINNAGTPHFTVDNTTNCIGCHN